MFPLSHMMKSFIRKGRLTVIDADGKRHVFAGTPGLEVTMRLTDKRLYRTLVFNPELAAGEAYMDGTMLAHWAERFEKNRERVIAMYDERFARMWEFYLISAEMMFRTGSQLVFHMQMSRKRDAAPIVRDYITDRQREYIKREKALNLAV